jgi:molecular chaperone DnaK
MLVDHLAELFKDEHGLDPREDRKALARLTHAAEQAKIELSAQPFVRVREEYLLEKGGRARHLDVEIERHTLEALIADRLADTLTAFDQALADAGLKASDLAKVLFVGGSTRIPLVWQMVAEHTGQEPMVEINPDEAVALGAGVQAAILSGEPIDTVLVDVTPHSIGIEVAEWQFGEIVPDRYGVIVHRNTTLPTRRAQVFSALFSDQTAIHVKVYQGEAPIASQNTLLGEFLFEGLEPEIRGEPPRITVEFDLDLNGILNISAVDRGSGAARQTTLHAAHTRLSPSAQEASARYLADLERAPVEAEGDDPLLARARHVLETQRENVDELSQLVADLTAAKREGRGDEAAELSEQLLDLLYELEDDLDEEEGADEEADETEPGDGRPA